MKSDFVDYYARLGLVKGATDQEIKLAYRKLAKTCHPDHHQGSASSEEQFKRLSEAYSILSKSCSRVDYDLSYTRYETAKAAQYNDELANMKRAMRMHVRKSRDVQERRERRQMRDPNRPVRRRPLLLRRETPPPRIIIFGFVVIWMFALASLIRNIFF